jgi:hypothetical protein
MNIDRDEIKLTSKLKWNDEGRETKRKKTTQKQQQQNMRECPVKDLVNTSAYQTCCVQLLKTLDSQMLHKRVKRTPKKNRSHSDLNIFKEIYQSRHKYTTLTGHRNEISHFK